MRVKKFDSILLSKILMDKENQETIFLSIFNMKYYLEGKNNKIDDREVIRKVGQNISITEINYCLRIVSIISFLQMIDTIKTIHFNFVSIHCLQITFSN